MRAKYGNRKVTVDGMVFDSRKEARYYLFLKEAEKNGEISDLRMQVPYEIVPAIYEDEEMRPEGRPLRGRFRLP